MKIINPNAPGRFQGAVEWFRINTPEDRLNLIGEPGEMLLCESNGQQWKWDTASASWIPATGAVASDGSTSYSGPVNAPNLPVLNPDSSISMPGPVQAPGPGLIKTLKTRSAGANLFYAAPTATSASAWTIGEQIPVAAPYWGVQPIFVNNNKDAQMEIGAAKIASAPTDNAAAEGLTWASLTVGLATAFNVPAATVDTTTGVLKPALLEGDPIPLASVARTDFPTKSPLLHFRALYPNGAKFSAVGAGNTEALRLSTGLEYSNFLANSDQVTTPTGSPSATSAAYRGVMLKFLFKSLVFDLLVIGDSTNAGTGSNSSIFTAAREAKRLAKFPMEVVNFAIGGQTMRYTYNHWRAIIASGYRPRAVLIPTWTVNTSLNAAGFANTITYAMTIASEAMDLGIIPILQTPPPASSITGGNVALWQAHYAMVLALEGQYIVADQTKSVMDPNNPAHYLASLTPDGLHPNEAGHVAKGVDLLPVLERIAL